MRMQHLQTIVSVPQADAVAKAEETGQPVKHPWLNGRSSTPNLASDFFMRMLHPVPEKRMSIIEAYAHPYVKEAVEALELQQTHTTAAATAATPFADVTNTILTPGKPFVKGQW